MKNHSLCLLIVFLFTACSVKYEPNNLNDTQINKLAYQIKLLSPDIKNSESKHVAYEAINYSLKLANEYDLVSPPLFNNLLINMDIKQRGLCYHFANDLKKHLQNQNYKSFYFIRAVANKGEYFEHSSIVLTRDDISFENSLVLDPWRNSGKLYFGLVKDDKKYKWKRK